MMHTERMVLIKRGIWADGACEVNLHIKCSLFSLPPIGFLTGLKLCKRMATSPETERISYSLLFGRISTDTRSGPSSSYEAL